MSVEERVIVPQPDPGPPGKEPRFADRWRNWLTPKNLILFGTILILLWLALAPLFMLIWGSFRTAGPGAPGAAYTLQNYVTAFTEPFLYEVIWNTLVYAFGSTIVSVVVGVGLAWLVERTNIFFRNAIFILVVVRIAVPQMMMTIAWILLLSPKIGWINHLIEQVTGIEALINIYSMAGMIWVEGVDKAPIVFLLAAAAFRSLDPTYEEAALMSGARLKSIMRFITVPLIIPAIAAGILLAFLTNFESFEVPTLIGLREGIQTMSSAIYFLTTGAQVEIPMSSTYGMMFFVIAALGLFLYQKVTAENKKYMTITGKGHRPTRIDLGPWRTPVSIITVIFLLSAYILPIFILFWTSLLPFYSVPSLEAFSRLSLDNFSFIFNQGTTNRSLRNSLILAAASGTLVMFLTGTLSWLLVRTRSLMSRMVDLAIFVPITFPGIVLGLSLMWTYIIFPIGIYGTIFILLIAYLTKFMPQGMRFSNSAAMQVHVELEEAAQVHGASWGQTVRSITFPLMAPGLLVGWLYVMTYSFREVPVSILLYSPGNEVIAVNAFNLWQNGETGASTAIGVMIVLILGTIAGATRLLARRTGVSTD